MKYLWIGIRLKKNHGGTIKTRFKFGLSWSVSLDAREQPTFARLDKSACSKFNPIPRQNTRVALIFTAKSNKSVSPFLSVVASSLLENGGGRQ